MATGWAGDGAVQDQIDATVKDGIKRARSQLPQGPGLERCEECDAPIPEARRKAVPGVKLCVPCQQARDEEDGAHSRLQPPRQQGQSVALSWRAHGIALWLKEGAAERLGWRPCLLQ